MNILPFDKKELEPVGNYPLVMNDYMTKPGFYTAKLSTPITPRENWERFFKREKPLWVPDGTYDLNYMCPLFHPDVRAGSTTGGIDSFGVKWVAVPNEKAMVEPGFKIMDSMAEREEKVVWPDIEAWPWEEAAAEYSVQDPDRPNAVFYTCGMFERMISLLGFMEAAVSFLDEPEATHAFLDRLVEHNINVFDHYRRYMNMELLLFSDDWGSQLYPFFSKDVVEEFLMPRYKKMVDWCHSHNIRFMHHCCGEVTSFVPYMIEAGVDAWEVNFEAVEPKLMETIEKYGDQILFDAYFGMLYPLSSDQETFKEQVRAYYDKWGSTGKVSVTVYDFNKWDFDSRSYCYQVARETYCK